MNVEPTKHGPLYKNAAHAAHQNIISAKNVITGSIANDIQAIISNLTLVNKVIENDLSEEKQKIFKKLLEEFIKTPLIKAVGRIRGMKVWFIQIEDSIAAMKEEIPGSVSSGNFQPLNEGVVDG